MLIIIIGIQQQKSVITMKISLLAIADSLFILVDRTARAERLTVQNIKIYATKINVNETKFKPMKKEAEYSQPAGVPSDS